MRYLKISNAGLLAVEALSLLGASTKRSDNSKIGMFGSGNKYALAYLLRNNFELHIFSGTNEIKLSTVEKRFRDQVFQVVCVNGQETSITTEFGLNWELWQALRELYCNALDEGGQVLEFVQTITPVEGETHFYIKNRPELAHFIGSFDRYFSENREVLFECKTGKILSKAGGDEKVSIFRKGIRCYDSPKISIYDYDLNNVEIGENRLISNTWQLPSTVWKLIYQCDNEAVIRNVLHNVRNSEYMESLSNDYLYADESDMSETFKEVIKGMTVAPLGMAGLLSAEEQAQSVLLPDCVFKQVRSFLGDGNVSAKFKSHGSEMYIEYEPDEMASATLRKASDFFTQCKYPQGLEYPIILARFQNKEILGMADLKKKLILLSDICIGSGVQAVISTIIEEYIHLTYEVADNTRGFQNSAIQEIVNILKTSNTYLI